DRIVQFRRRRPIQMNLTHVADNTDDCAARSLLTYRICITKNQPRQRFVDDNDRQGAASVLSGKRPASFYGNAQCVKISRSDIAEFHQERRHFGGSSATPPEVERIGIPSPTL